MKLKDSLNYTPSELGFGTSGLRGLVSDMTDLECYINTLGFLEYLKAVADITENDTILIAGDLRTSTPDILLAVAEAIADAELKSIYYGTIPTPALAYSGLLEASASIMVTGSHIPADRNGIKFYKVSGEVLKEDEAAIKKSVAEVRQRLYEQDEATSKFDSTGRLRKYSAKELLHNPSPQAEQKFIQRNLKVFPGQPLKGKRVVVYQHSAVGRDLLVSVLESLGASVTAYGRSNVFVPIDTENVTQKDKELFKKIAHDYPDTFAIVSTDGDSDRPFVIDSQGEFYRGDILGCVVAQFLGANYAAYPISSNDAADAFCKQHTITYDHTKIGSPYVITAMQAAESKHSVVVGWEVNGGFLTGNDITINTHTLQALPTRDALLPILVALISASQRGSSIAELFAQLPKRFTDAGLLDNVPQAAIADFNTKLSSGGYTTQTVADLLGVTAQEIVGIDTTDGLRIIFTKGEVVHFRPSGNAPQVRVYTNCDSETEASDIVQRAIQPGGYLEKLLGKI